MGYLFSKQHLYTLIQQTSSRATKTADDLSDDKVLAHTVEELVEAVAQQHEIEPLDVKFGELKGTDGEMNTTLRGLDFRRGPIQQRVVRAHIPYTGDRKLFDYRPSRSTNLQPAGEVTRTEVILIVVSEGKTSEQTKRELNEECDRLRQYVGWLNEGIESSAVQLRRELAQRISQRRARVEASRKLLADLDIPVKHVGPERAYEIPVKRKTINLAAAPPTRVAEPKISDALYEEIVATISGFTNALERLPGSASRLAQEETLRDFLLFILNSNYQGHAAGEVFNNHGKTDILLRYQDENAFIGECKFWKGQAKFAEAVDQLLRYTGWRDTKIALILFIRDGKVTEIIEKADACLREHANFRSTKPSPEPDRRRNYTFTASDDAQRVISLTFLPVVIPKA
jgi:hypothetical protein